MISYMISYSARFQMNKPALTRRRGGLPQRDNSYFRFAACTGTTVYKSLTVELSSACPLISQSPVASTWP